MPGAWDDDDWVGTPPEGRHTRDQARPDFWARQRPPMIVAGAIGLLILVAVVIALAA